MSLFKFLWALDALAFIIVIGFFVAGLADNTVSANNIGLWLLILSSLSAIIFGSIWLKSHEHTIFAFILVSLLLIPALFYFIFMLVAMFGNVRWN